MYLSPVPLLLICITAWIADGSGELKDFRSVSKHATFLIQLWGSTEQLS